MSFLLHPPPVDESGLAAALEAMVDELGNRSGLRTLFHSNLIGRLPELFETNLYRVVQEALINVQRHARATQAVVRCMRSGNFITVEIEDDGIGFDIDPRAALAGVGMRAMRERVNETRRCADDRGARSRDPGARDHPGSGELQAAIRREIVSGPCVRSPHSIHRCARRGPFAGLQTCTRWLRAA